MDKTTRPAFNLTFDVDTVGFHQSKAGEPYMSATVTTLLRGTKVTRTLIARDEALDVLKAVVVPGAKGVRIHCRFANLETNDNGTRGSEYLVALGLPNAQAA